MLKTKDQQIQDLKLMLKEKNAQLDKKDNQIQDVKIELAKKNTEPKTKDTEIKDLKLRLKDRDAEICKIKDKKKTLIKEFNKVTRAFSVSKDTREALKIQNTNLKRSLESLNRECEELHGKLTKYQKTHR